MNARVSQKRIAEMIRAGAYREVADMMLDVCEGKERVMSPADVGKFVMKEIGAKRREVFLCVYLNGAHKVIESRIVTEGIVNRTIVHPVEVFRPAFLNGAVAVIVAHNHPSGETAPSPEDLEITRRLVEAGEVLGVTILDHIIASSRSWVSLKETGGME